MTKPDVLEDDAPEGRSHKGLALKLGGLLILALFGGVAGYGLGKLAKAQQIEISAQSVTASGLAASLVVMGGLVMLFAGLGRNWGSSLQGYKLSSKERLSYALQGAILLLAGAMLALVEGGQWIGLAGSTGFGLIAGLMAIQTTLNVWVWRASDELIRRVSIEAGAFCFWLLQGCLFLYAAAEQFALVPTVSAWSLTLVLMGVYLISSTVLVIRRGLS